LKFLIKLEGLENFDVKSGRKGSGRITGSDGEGATASFYVGVQGEDPSRS